ncbi:MAG: family 16 glycoside hydrolase, partial [Acidobacteriota bacterium]
MLPYQRWRVHDIDRPKPVVVTPAATAGGPPSDALVLLDGKDLSRWTFRGKKDRPKMDWKLENGYMEVVPGAGDALTKESFGDMQLHIEWSAPTEISGDSQWRANSGVLIMGMYEIQV